MENTINAHLNNLPDNFSICFYTNEKNIPELRNILFNRFAQRYENGCYVSTHVPFADLKKKFGRKKNFLGFSFIDGVTKHSGLVYEEHKNCIYLEKADAGELNLAMHGLLRTYEQEKAQHTLVLVDSFSTLFANNHISDLKEFSEIFSRKLKKSKTNAIVLASKEDMEKGLLPVMKSFCNKVVKV